MPVTPISDRGAAEWYTAFREVKGHYPNSEVIATLDCNEDTIRAVLGALPNVHALVDVALQGTADAVIELSLESLRMCGVYRYASWQQVLMACTFRAPMFLLQLHFTLPQVDALLHCDELDRYHTSMVLEKLTPWFSDPESVAQHLVDNQAAPNFAICVAHRHCDKIRVSLLQSLLRLVAYGPMFD